MVIIEISIQSSGTYGFFPQDFFDMVRWMQDNVGEMYVDWRFVACQNQKFVHLEIEDEGKATLTKLRWA